MLNPVFVVSNAITETDNVLTCVLIAVFLLLTSADHTPLRDTSAVVKLTSLLEIATLNDKIMLLRTTVSVDNASLIEVSIVVNDTDALLNAVDNEVISLSRVEVSAERTLTNPASIETSDGMAVLLMDAISLTRVDVSADTEDFNVDTLLNVLALRVRLGFVCISDAILPRVLNRVDTPLNTFEIAADMLEFRVEVSVTKLDEIIVFALVRDDTDDDNCDEMEVI